MFQFRVLLIWIPSQRRSQDLGLGRGAPADATRYFFSSSPVADRIQWGGGGVADMFRVPRPRTRFSVGGGGGGSGK